MHCVRPDVVPRAKACKMPEGTFCFGPWEVGEDVWMGQHCWGNQRLARVAGIATVHTCIFFTQLHTFFVQCPVIFVAFLRVELNKDSNM